MARAFLTRESFFTTQVKNTSVYQSGDVLVAPSDPGGVALHRVVRGEEIILTSGAYLAADENVNIKSSVSSPFSGFSNFSGSGIFLLKASGQGNLAICAYGSMHKYTLASSEQRCVDNGHIVAWSSNMKTTMRLASGRGGILGSMTSGEGLMCLFEGPGTVYVQSHKPNIGPDGARGTRNGGGRSTGNPVVACIIFLIVILIFLGTFAAVYFGLDVPRDNIQYGGQQRYRQHQQQRYDGGQYRQNEF